MIRRMIVGALATVALAVTGPAAAKPGKGGGHGVAKAAKLQAKGKARANPNAKAKANARANKANANARGRASARGEAHVPAQRRQKSQGPAHASPRALERASPNSVLAGNTVVVGPLAGLSVGTPVRLGDEVVGTVERIVPAPERKVSNVLVRTNDGRIVPLRPDSLTVDGGVWTAASLRRDRDDR